MFTPFEGSFFFFLFTSSFCFFFSSGIFFFFFVPANSSVQMCVVTVLETALLFMDVAIAGRKQEEDGRAARFFVQTALP